MGRWRRREFSRAGVSPPGKMAVDLLARLFARGRDCQLMSAEKAARSNPVFALCPENEARYQAAMR